jgi:hypothetical protein
MTPRAARTVALAACVLTPFVSARAQRADAVALRWPAASSGTMHMAAPSLAAPRLSVPRLGALEQASPVALPHLSVSTDPIITRPDLEPGRVAGELLVGSYGGITGFFVGHYLAREIVGRVSNASDQASDNIAFATGVVGAWAGTTVGVFAIGNIGNQTGSLGTTAFGAGLGAVAGAFLDRLVFAPRSGDPSAGASTIRWGETIVESFLPSIGATIAFNSSRKYK